MVYNYKISQNLSIRGEAVASVSSDADGDDKL